MQEAITSFVGLDVHKDSIAIAVAQAGRESPRFVGTVGPELSGLCKALRRLAPAQHTLVVYEAGPCGYGLARHLNAHGYLCEVIAPTRIARGAAERRIKTDRRDALLLARESRASNLVPVVMPDARDEALRDLSRTREDACAARLRARLQLKALLLRHGLAYQGKESWTLAHERYLSMVRLAHPAQQIAFEEYRQAVNEAHQRVHRLTEQLREHSAAWRMNPVVKALMTLRGLDSVAAVTFVAEVGDLSRFAHPRALMGYLGLVPSEYSTGQTRHQGGITKTGNKHARRILIEAAWNYRFGARVSRDLQLRQQDQPQLIRDIAWRAQLRLSTRFKRLRVARHLPHNKVCVAIARELAGFIWDIGRQVRPID